MFASSVVYIVDDDPAALEAVSALVGVMGISAKMYSSAESFLKDYDGHRPGCLITDVRMLGMSGIELQEELDRRGNSLSVIVLTAYPDTRTTIRAIKGGAVTLLEKPCRDQELWDAIRTALAEDERRFGLEQHMAAIRQRLATLTSAERRVLDRIVAGDSNKAMAHRLGVSVRTIEVRRSNIFKKMHAESVAELVRLYLEVQGESGSSG
ncbi:MAG: response regulator [Planctomycetes bacterium]|nr:response regulator [Planctomycetota bacterium]